MLKTSKCDAKKSLLIAAAFTSLTASHALAASYGLAGCGLGSVIFESNNTWWKQVLAATTNGTAANQTFGITSCTSNCGSGASAQALKQKDYVSAILASLQREGAQGTGDVLNGFAQVFGCSANDFNHFGAFSQSNSKVIFNSNDPSQIISNV
ncbi:DUF3015 family protein [Fluviispira multicolorata]|uniref:DUF3015 domain-containing protein n=1 Tax=Fluviispira multicolorata TaxID=2654512 RepID=A0A833JF64_9BACT|nr:DUF3015 family protein [Fluviispira multicolorata]KAB8033258.1 DUF3015 domain-containing protein [Fluviispira multicolorata]